jgi:hypothetical protein
MITGKTTRVSSISFVVLALGCGGRSENQGNTGVGGGEAAGGSPSVAVAGSAGSVATPGVGPIDATGLPAELPMNCGGMTPPARLALPCKVGGPLNGQDGPGSLNVLECYDLAGGTALSDFIPFGDLPAMLNQPVQIPFSSLPQPPNSGAFKLSGTAMFSQVDPVGRAFVARLIGGTITWTGANNETLTCAIPDTPFWGVQGGFL